ncbi:MAG: TonB C-terminal domain-containing protein, partial [Cyanobacteria bacterium]|nr:TonB C-terminal domain-containing protein [Cyanobacteriota bacterium]
LCACGLLILMLGYGTVSLGTSLSAVLALACSGLALAAFFSRSKLEVDDSEIPLSGNWRKFVRLAGLAAPLPLLALFSMGVMGSFIGGTLHEAVASVETVVFDHPFKPVAKGEVDFGPYMAKLQRTLKARWSPPKRNFTHRERVVFKIDKNGHLSNVRMTYSNGDAETKQAALDSCKIANVDPLPAGAPDSVDILFTFDYNVKRE